jgi:hypothetical protein
MPFGWRKRIGLGRFMSLNLSKRGASLTGRVGPLSSSTRSRKTGSGCRSACIGDSAELARTRRRDRERPGVLSGPLPFP